MTKTGLAMSYRKCATFRISLVDVLYSGKYLSLYSLKQYRYAIIRANTAANDRIISSATNPTKTMWGIIKTNVQYHKHQFFLLLQRNLIATL